MRRCPRCDVEMREGFLLREERAGRPIGLYKTGKIFGEVDYLKAAVCPNCGEVSLYLPNVAQLEYWKEPEK